MIRLSNRQALYCLAALMYVRRQVLDAQMLMEEFAGLTGEPFTDFFNMRHHVIETLRDELPGQLEAALSQKAGDQDLLTVIGDILTESGPRNVLGNDTIQLLREAILPPGNQAAAIAALKKKDKSCASCGSRILDGDLASFRQGAFCCIHCFTPQFRRCMTRGCGAPIDISGFMHSKRFCNHCKEQTKTGRLSQALRQAVAEDGTPTPFDNVPNGS